MCIAAVTDPFSPSTCPKSLPITSVIQGSYTTRGQLRHMNTKLFVSGLRVAWHSLVSCMQQNFLLIVPSRHAVITGCAISANGPLVADMVLLIFFDFSSSCFFWSTLRCFSSCQYWSHCHFCIRYEGAYILWYPQGLVIIDRHTGL